MNTASISFPLFGEGFVIDPPGYFTIFGFDIYLYGLFITAGFTLAALYLLKRRDVFGLTKDNILDQVIIAVPCGLVGARIYYMLFNFGYYFGPGKWQNIIAFREGGLAVYGGIIGGAIAFYVYSRVKKIPIGNLLDAAGFGLLIGQAIGRWGNFFNREAYGVETGLPWRMGLTFKRYEYIQSMEQVIPPGETHYFHPAFLYESLWNATGLLLMHIFSKKSKTKYPGQYFLFYVAWYGLGRFMIEGIRIDSLYLSGTGIRVSQALAAASFLIAASLLVRNHLRAAIVPGGAGGAGAPTEGDAGPEPGNKDSESVEGASGAGAPTGGDAGPESGTLDSKPEPEPEPEPEPKPEPEPEPEPCGVADGVGTPATEESDASPSGSPGERQAE